MPSREIDGPLLVFGPRSTSYDFGPSHPLTPRRFGPGIDLLRAVGAEPGLTPEPASDAELEWIHEPDYVATVRALSSRAAPGLAGGLSASGYGLGPGDTPAFTGMHDAAAAVAGGSLRAMEAILAGEVEHAFHPGGGLHHAMPRRASGFCVYDDPALAIARARREGLRVLYLDFDVHHGDGVQAIHWNDPEVVTISVHETGRALFPGTGFVNELGGPDARGSKLNVPLDPGTGERGWLAAIERVVPEVADGFRPQIVVSQHGSDGHAWDPLAHLRLTTTAMGAAARLVDSIAHRWAGGRWLATGGGGYDAYRVVPRVWSLVWLAGAHRVPPPRLPDAWLERWAPDAEAYGQSPMPGGFEDPPNAGHPFGRADDALDRRAAEAAEAALAAWRSGSGG
ncbi:MAG TPA: acetoin utilization protein AcuC [Candidatus Limnocylindrales bacterium]|nr:acetoin utilization protein AcuC [Candidatus Limnocylindrales bacterium]